MSDGATHARVAGTVLLLGACAGTLAVMVEPQSIEAVIPCMLGLLNGYLVTPDIDMQGSTIEELRWKSFPFIGRLIFFLFASFWYPYSLLFAHRGLSHFPVIGTLSRWLYEVLVLGGLAWLIFRPDGGTWINNLLSIQGWWLSLGFFLGAWMIQDFGHLLFDMKPPWRRSKKASRGRVKGGKRQKGSYPTAPSYGVFIAALKGTELRRTPSGT